jgi:regulator of sirC expression with transglutaminase-like and TPR domain
MKTLSETELKSLVQLLDEEDPGSLNLVRRQILCAGDAVLPFLEELKAGPANELATRADSMAREIRFKKLRREFAMLSVVQEPDLEKGVLLLSRFGYPSVNPATYTAWMDKVALRVQDELPSDADAGMTFQRLNSYLFQALGFAGNSRHYDDPDNCYLNWVIDNRRGVPESLSVLYLLLAKRLRLPVYGVGTPGHFLVGFRPGPYACFIDAYHRGRLLDKNEVRRMLERKGFEFKSEYLDRCSTRDILVRMMRNLIAVYDKTGAPDRAQMLAKLVGTVRAGPARAP